jgi:hypothetical protein
MASQFRFRQITSDVAVDVHEGVLGFHGSAHHLFDLRIRLLPHPYLFTINKHLNIRLDAIQAYVKVLLTLLKS